MLNSWDGSTLLLHISCALVCCVTHTHSPGGDEVFSAGDLPGELEVHTAIGRPSWSGCFSPSTHIGCSSTFLDVIASKGPSLCFAVFSSVKFQRWNPGSRSYQSCIVSLSHMSSPREPYKNLYMLYSLLTQSTLTQHCISITITLEQNKRPKPWYMLPATPLRNCQSAFCFCGFVCSGIFAVVEDLRQDLHGL